MALGLVRHIEVLGQDVTGTGPAKAAADAMHDAMVDATERYLGAGMAMSGFKGGPVVFKVQATGGNEGMAKLTLSGGTYALADKGRRRARKKLYAKPRKRRGQRRAALDTPSGIRRSVRGSRWQGFGVTKRHGPDAIDEGVVAAIKVIRSQAKG